MNVYACMHACMYVCNLTSGTTPPALLGIPGKSVWKVRSESEERTLFHCAEC